MALASRLVFLGVLVLHCWACPHFPVQTRLNLVLALAVLAAAEEEEKVVGVEVVSQEPMRASLELVVVQVELQWVAWVEQVDAMASSMGRSDLASRQLESNPLVVLVAFHHPRSPVNPVTC